MTLATEAYVNAIILIGVFCGAAFAALYAWHTTLVKIDVSDHQHSAHDRLVDETARSHDDGHHDLSQALRDVKTISEAIATGANAFLYKEYQYLSVFIVGFGLLLLLCIGLISDWGSAVFTVIAFVTGAVTSITCGFIGMKIAVYANSRTCVSALHGYGPAFVTSFKAGCVMGFALTSIGIFVLYILLHIFHAHWSNSLVDKDQAKLMYESIAGYGLGGSAIALFGRVGGGIYTKAADVGADLVGKVEQGMPEDDPRNPAVIADNVGDNVGDIAGMGADLFGSFAESACAAMVVASQSDTLRESWTAMTFPLVLASCGIVVCIITSFVATHLMIVSKETEIEPSLKRQILVSTLLMTPVAFIVCNYFLPETFDITHTHTNVKNWYVFFCVAAGLWSGMIIGYTTEYYTSHSYTPVREVANACETGPATNIIYGLALGYKSVIIPVFCIAITIYISYSLAGMFGIACGALGILSPLAIDLTIDAYGPICDNAGGIAEMAHLPPDVREKTDALDGAGNTTAAIGKGFAIGSAALVSLALFGAFVTTVGLAESEGVDILQPFQFAGLLVGAMLPYWFSAMTMKSVGKAALDMVVEVRNQFKIPGVLQGTTKPDYARCVAISTAASLREMIPPGCLVLLTPIIVGFVFGVKALAGVLAGALVSGVQMAISASNTGGAWDNAKKYIAAGGLGEDKRKHTPQHDAAVIGDTVGDPLKDTSGPSLNILIKLMAIISVVFAQAFPKAEKGGLIEQLFNR